MAKVAMEIAATDPGLPSIDHDISGCGRLDLNLSNTDLPDATVYSRLHGPHGLHPRMYSAPSSSLALAFAFAFAFAFA